MDGFAKWLGVAALTRLKRKCKGERESRIVTGSEAWKARSM